MNESNPSCCSTYRNIMGKDIAGMHPSARSKFCNNRPCRMDEQREDKVGKRGFPYPILSADTTNKLRRDAGKSTCFGGYTITGTPLFPTTSADPTKKCRECFDFPQYFDCRDRTLGVYSLFVLSVFSLLYMAVSFCVDPVMSVHEEEAMQETDFRRQVRVRVAHPWPRLLCTLVCARVIHISTQLRRTTGRTSRAGTKKTLRLAPDLSMWKKSWKKGTRLSMLLLTEMLPSWHLRR